MKRILTVAGAALIMATLAACSPGIHTLDSSITFDSDGLVVHASGHPNAHVSSDGDLNIGGKTVAVTPAQRQLLKRYYQQAHDTMHAGEAVGKQGVRVATRSIGAAIRSIFHGESSAAKKQLDAQSQSIETAANTLCGDINTLGATQQAIANQIPAFKPYASSNQLKCKITHTTTYTTAGTPHPSAQGAGTASKSFSSSSSNP
ncbi:MAG TPA: DUF2884 family protein [Rhodanobacteraceae bacterium]|nr:DUF2884 family protein [Oleiagrimonas sp.]HET9818308.1 DUF2884 family protein [Rhodanobacteraceae bacterium]